MSSAVHSDRTKEQIACKGFIRRIKHTAAQSKLSVPLYLLRNRSAWEKKPRHSKQRQSRGSPSYLTRYFHRNLVHLHGRRPRKRVHTAEMTGPSVLCGQLERHFRGQTIFYMTCPGSALWKPYKSRLFSCLIVHARPPFPFTFRFLPPVNSGGTAGTVFRPIGLWDEHSPADRTAF